MIMFCPYCEEEHDVRVIEQEETVSVRSEDFTVMAKYYVCPEIGEEFETSDSPHDSLADAYRQYRDKHHMLSPDEIRAFRHEYELTQKELSDFLGWGAVTLSRYENGSLQDLAHDNQLQLIRNNPDSFLEILHRRPDVLDEDKRKRLVAILGDKRDTRQTTLDCVVRKLRSNEPSIYNGFIRFNIEKFMGAVEFFCSRVEIFPTKLNKLLFYSDYLHYRNTLHSLTGAAYAHATYGPVPDDYKILLAMMEEELSILQSEEITEPYPGEKLTSIKTDHIKLLDDSELRILSEIEKSLGNLSCAALSDISHSEDAYNDTISGELIAYDYADTLKGISNL